MIGLILVIKAAWTYSENVLSVITNLSNCVYQFSRLRTNTK